MFLNFKRVFHLLGKSDKLRYLGLTFANSSTSLFDLAGVVLSGLTGVLAYSFYANVELPNAISNLILNSPIRNLSMKHQLLTCGLLIIVLFIGKSAIGIYLSFRNLRFLRSLAVNFTNRMYQDFSEVTYFKVKKLPRESFSYALTDGVLQLFLGVLGSYITIFAECTFLFLVLFIMIVVDPMLAIILICIFGALLLITNKSVSKRIIASGSENVKRSLEGKRLVAETKLLFRELAVSGNFCGFSKKYNINREKASIALMQMNFLQQFPKYFLEFITVISGVVLLLSNGGNYGVGITVGKITLYLAALVRLVPSLLRIQTAIVAIQSGLGGIETTMEAFHESRQKRVLDNQTTSNKVQVMRPGLVVEGLTFKYSDSYDYLVKDLSLTIKDNTLTALIGRSGSGKSTLLDLVLGFLEPTSGQIWFDGLQVHDYIQKNPGKISIIPQDVILIEGTLLENITLGVPEELVDQNLLDFAITNSMMKQVVEDLPQGLATPVEEGGSRFSGGQKQRIVIARALYTNPKFIFLDEPTSALDEQTERDFISILSNLKRITTLFVISHRKSSLEIAERCLVLEEGIVREINDPTTRNMLLRNLEETNEIF
jgi:ABC-type multidrug transport system fused ATPase/permease subunit